MGEKEQKEQEDQSANDSMSKAVQTEGDDMVRDLACDKALQMEVSLAGPTGEVTSSDVGNNSLQKTRMRTLTTSLSSDMAR